MQIQDENRQKFTKKKSKQIEIKSLRRNRLKKKKKKVSVGRWKQGKLQKIWKM